MPLKINLPNSGLDCLRSSRLHKACRECPWVLEARARQIAICVDTHLTNGTKSNPHDTSPRHSNWHKTWGIFWVRGGHQHSKVFPNQLISSPKYVWLAAEGEILVTFASSKFDICFVLATKFMYSKCVMLDKYLITMVMGRWLNQMASNYTYSWSSFL